MLRILEFVPHAAHAAYYADIVRQHSLRRRLGERAHRLRLAAADENADINRVLQLAADLPDELDVGGQGFDLLSAAEFNRAEFELNYLIEGVLVEGQPAILCGHKKNLKTNVSVDLVLSLSNQQPFLGKFFVSRPVRVGVFSGESGGPTLQETARRIAKAKGMPFESFDNSFWSTRLPSLTDKRSLLQLKRAIRSHELKAIVVDPAYLALDLSDDAASNLFKVGKRLRPITDLCAAEGVTFILLHHMTNSTAKDFGPPDINRIAFAGFTEWMRQWIMLGRRREYDADEPGHHELWLSLGGSAGHGSLWALNIDEGSIQDEGGRRWDVELLQPSEARAEAAREAEERREEERQQKAERQAEEDQAIIISRMRETYPRGEVKSAIRDLSGLNSKRFDPAFARIIANGQVEPCEVTRGNGQTYPGFKPASVTRTTGESK